MTLQIQLLMLGRAVLAVVLGMIVGCQRARSGAVAGMRTFAMVTLGACAFGLTSLVPNTEPTRIAAQAVSGIGFLCAGVILHGQDHVHGLTTAATIWCCGALGLLVAFGAYSAAVGATMLMLAVLAMPKSK